MLPVGPVEESIRAAAAARKCHTCGCFHDAVAALEGSALGGALAAALYDSRATFGERKQDCLGCKVCWPADAINAASALVELPPGAGCPTDAVVPRAGWPPLPGTYGVVRATAPVAVCTLHSRELAEALVSHAPDGLAIAGPMQTENLGIERLVENVLANPSIRVLIVAGADTAGAVGHFPGQSLLALAEAGVDERMRIVGAKGRRPVLANIDAERVARFRDQVRLLDHRGVEDAAALAAVIADAASTAPAPLGEALAPRGVPEVAARRPGKLIPDPAGYVVIWPDFPRCRLVAEHYANDGVLQRVIAGERAPDVLATLLAEGGCSRLDHAAYLGRELTRAETALHGGPAYVQDRAPDVEPSTPTVAASCGTGCGCGPGEPNLPADPTPAAVPGAQCAADCGCEPAVSTPSPGAPMKQRLLILAAVVLAVGGVLAAKSFQSPGSVATSASANPASALVTTADASTPVAAKKTVLLFADLREADSSCGCGEIIRAAREAGKRAGVTYSEHDAKSSSEEQARWNVKSLPTVLILGPDGKETARFEGEGPDTLTGLEAALASLGA